MDRLPSSVCSSRGSMAEVSCAMTGFSASTTLRAASGSEDSSRQYTYARSRRSGLSVSCAGASAHVRVPCPRQGLPHMRAMALWSAHAWQ